MAGMRRLLPIYPLGDCRSLLSRYPHTNRGWRNRAPPRRQPERSRPDRRSDTEQSGISRRGPPETHTNQSCLRRRPPSRGRRPGSQPNRPHHFRKRMRRKWNRGWSWSTLMGAVVQVARSLSIQMVGGNSPSTLSPRRRHHHSQAARATKQLPTWTHAIALLLPPQPSYASARVVVQSPTSRPERQQE